MLETAPHENSRRVETNSVADAPEADSIALDYPFTAAQPKDSDAPLSVRTARLRPMQPVATSKPLTLLRHASGVATQRECNSVTRFVMRVNPDNYCCGGH